VLACHDAERADGIREVHEDTKARSYTFLWLELLGTFSTQARDHGRVSITRMLGFHATKMLRAFVTFVPS
jgi:hypothetical protein